MASIPGEPLLDCFVRSCRITSGSGLGARPGELLVHVCEHWCCRMCCVVHVSFTREQQFQSSCNKLKMFRLNVDLGQG